MKAQLKGPVPNLVLAQRVVEKMAQAAARFIQDETGEAMIGLLTPSSATGIPTLYVLDTIPPDEDDVVRQFHTFQQGDERQYEIFTWHMENWAAFRAGVQVGAYPPALRRFDHPLQHIGDWHKQPGYMIAPSHGDLRSALEQMDGNDQAFLLAPIVTLGHPATTQPGPGANYLTIDDGQGTLMRVDFWYIERGVPVFFPIIPAVYPDDQLPPMAPLPWHIVDDARASLEVGQLDYDDLLVSPFILWDSDGRLPLEACIVVARSGMKRVLLIATPHDCPASPPRAYHAPMVPMGADDDWYEVFGAMWADAQPLDDPDGWQWRNDDSDEDHPTYLVDYVQALESAYPDILRAAPSTAAGDDGSDDPDSTDDADHSDSAPAAAPAAAEDEKEE